MHYIMRLKGKRTSTSNRVSRIEANSIEEAKFLFMGRKQMNESTFDKLYIIEEDSSDIRQ